MKTDTEIRCEGLKALIASLGNVNAERFVALMSREAFDYTQWQRTLWQNMSIKELSAHAAAWCKKQKQMRGTNK